MMQIDSYFHVYIGSNIGAKGVKVLGDILTYVRKQKIAKRKQYQQVFTLILWSHQYSEKSAFHVLPLEMVHMILRFVLDDVPAATLDIYS